MRLHIVPIRHRLIPQRESFVLDINPSSTIQQLKETIAEHINVPASNQFLSFEGQTLENEHTLTSHDNIKDGSSIWLVVFPPMFYTTYHIFVSIYNPDSPMSEVFDLDVFYYDTVAQVKQAISERTAIPTSNQRLVWIGRELQDARVFSDYGIQKDSTVRVLIV